MIKFTKGLMKKRLEETMEFLQSVEDESQAKKNSEKKYGKES